MVHQQIRATKNDETARVIQQRKGGNVNMPQGSSSSSSSKQISQASLALSYFPHHIPHFEIRKNPRTNEFVRRGLIKSLGTKRHTLAEYKQLLECPLQEPELYGKGGALALAQHIPVTIPRLKRGCAWLESNCKMWTEECLKKVNEYEQGNYPKLHGDKKFLFGEPFVFTRMFRVIKGDIYYDWPWGVERLINTLDQNGSEKDVTTHARMVLGDVVRSISDLPDSVFFVSQEIQAFPSNVPFPSFSSSPHASTSSDIPMPWKNAYMFERDRVANGNLVALSDEGTSSSSSSSSASWPQSRAFNNSAWESRMDQAAWFGFLHDNDDVSKHAVARAIIINLANAYPEHVVANFTSCYLVSDIDPISTTGAVDCGPHYDRQGFVTRNPGVRNPNANFGTRDATLSIRRYMEKPVPMAAFMVAYKYLIVLGGVVSADRLGTLLAHSGAVLLLQETDFLYHFSARLKPWIHYVPLAFNAADLVEKVLWLKSHPNLARRLASNGKNFGASFLRLEDYHCYWASALEAVATVATPDALIPFKAKRVKLAPHHDKLLN